jgi:predicted alpha/beta-fold hydrolase
VKFIEEFEADGRLSFFNEKFAVKNFGYKDHHDYYYQASGRNVIP